MRFCCVVFKNAVLDAGNKGISVLCRNDEQSRCFYLQGRACDAFEEAKLKNLPKNIDIPKLRIVEQTGIQFCPFCGMKLDIIITENEAAFDELAKAHYSFLLH